MLRGFALCAILLSIADGQSIAMELTPNSTKIFDLDIRGAARALSQDVKNACHPYTDWNGHWCFRHATSWSNIKPNSYHVSDTSCCGEHGHCAKGECVHPNWKTCAVEKSGKACTCSGSVRYGKGATWSASKAVEGEIECSNGVFGDPLRGISKECQCCDASTHFQSGGQCHNKKQDGGTCTSSEQCSSGVCHSSRCSGDPRDAPADDVPGSCVEVPGNGPHVVTVCWGGSYLMKFKPSDRVPANPYPGLDIVCTGRAKGGWGVHKADNHDCTAATPFAATKRHMYAPDGRTYVCYFGCELLLPQTAGPTDSPTPMPTHRPTHQPTRRPTKRPTSSPSPKPISKTQHSIQVIIAGSVGGVLCVGCAVGAVLFFRKKQQANTFSQSGSSRSKIDNNKHLTTEMVFFSNPSDLDKAGRFSATPPTGVPQEERESCVP